MAFRHILGQERAVHLLQQALASGRLAHAHLFYGPPGTGKKLTALQFVKVLYCRSTACEACERCLSCRKIAAGNHPDVMVLATTGTSIGIESIRTLQQRLSYKPYESQRMTIIIDGCEGLTPPAANALLKTLEEPPDYALLLLLTGNKEALPLTIVSRCQLVPFHPLAAEHIRTILQQQGVAAAVAAQAATLCAGRLDAFAQHDMAQILAARQKAHTLFVDIIHGRMLTVFMRARQHAGKREACEELLYWWALLCRDLVMLKVAPVRLLYNQDMSSDLEQLATRLALDPLLAAFSYIEQRRVSLRMNLNPQLVFEQLLLQLQHLLSEAAEHETRLPH
jgi:DNA polymerase-3 subunit delta'